MNDDEPPLSAQAIHALMMGMAGLEAIPAKWLVAELLLTTCEIGADHARTDQGAAMLDRLSRLRFFKNGVLAFQGAHLAQWIMVNVTVASGLNAVLGGHAGQGRLLYAWERWLVDLIDIDLEDIEDRGQRVRLPPPDPERSLAQIGTEAEHWFGCLLLGLSKLSPRISAVLNELARQAPEARPERREPDGIAPPDVLAESGSLQR